MAIYYISYILGMAIFLAPVLATVVLYFKNRRNTNFAPQIKTIAIVDAVYLVLYILSSISSGTLVQSANSVIVAILNISCAVTVLYCAWKMKNGKGFKALFKNPGINSILFVAYLLTNFVILYQLAMTLFNYLFAGIAIVVVVWIAEKFALRGGKGLLSSGGGDGRCGTCANNNGQCILNPGAIPDPSASCPDYSPR